MAVIGKLSPGTSCCKPYRRRRYPWIFEGRNTGLQAFHNGKNVDFKVNWKKQLTPKHTTALYRANDDIRSSRGEDTIEKLATRIELLLRLQRYAEAVRLPLTSEKHIITRDKDVCITTGESTHLDILLAGSIAFHVVGLQAKAKAWCKHLLRKVHQIRNGSVNQAYDRYCLVAFAILGHSLLLENDISQSLAMFTNFV